MADDNLKIMEVYAVIREKPNGVQEVVGVSYPMPKNIIPTGKMFVPMMDVDRRTLQAYDDITYELAEREPDTKIYLVKFSNPEALKKYNIDGSDAEPGELANLFLDKKLIVQKEKEQEAKNTGEIVDYICPWCDASLGLDFTGNQCPKCWISLGWAGKKPKYKEAA